MTVVVQSAKNWIH